MTPLDTSQIAAVLALIAERSGLVFPDIRGETAVQAIGEFMVERNLRSDRELLNSGQLPELLERLVVHESFFDRDVEQLSFLGEIVVPELARVAPGKLRVWSAGCAGGEEPYTLAFMLAKAGLYERSTVLGTDLSEPALARARRGRYRAWSTRLGPGTPAARYLEPVDTQFQVPSRFVQTVSFRRLNLVEDAYPDGQHLILCRNVLIYFDPKSIEVVANKLAGALDRNGWLAVGPSDPRLDEVAPLDLVIDDRGMFYRPRTSARREATPLFATRSPAVDWVAPPSEPLEDAFERPPPSVPVRDVAPREAQPATVDVHEIRRLANVGDLPRAQAVLAAALTARPLDAELYFLQAVLAAERDPVAALASLTRCIYLDPTQVGAHLLAASLRRARGHTAEARQAYRATLTLLTRLPATDLVPWIDETAGSLTTVCRSALEQLDDHR
ncbi:protein-glutamate O-methyltransferase CheR [soil metagenome]